MCADRHQIPSGPENEYRASDDLLEWMNSQFSKFGDTFKASAYGTTVYATRDLRLSRHVLVENWRNYVKGRFIKGIAFLLGNGLMVSEGQLWKRQRRMIQPAFHHTTVEALVKMMARVNCALLEKWRRAAQTGESVNVTHDASQTALEVVLRAIAGEDYEQFTVHFDLLSNVAARDLAFAQAFRALGKIILLTVARRRSNHTGAPDIMSALMEARDPQSGRLMEDRQIVSEILTLIVAGHETTASTLNWTWYLLSQHPDVDKRLANEAANMNELSTVEDLSGLPYSRNVIEETMRLYPAGWLMTRKALNDDRLGEYFVPAGTEIYISPYFIQRHPAMWIEPDRFNPDRFGSQNLIGHGRLPTIPFSAGPRNCIGELFARVEMQLHLLIVAQHLRLRYAVARPIELDAGVNLRNKFDFIMYPELRSAARPH